MTDDLIERLAEQLVAARAIGAPRVDTAQALPGGSEGAYRVQAAVAARLGPVGAFKCGRRARQAVPRRAPVFAADVHPDGVELPMILADSPGVEIEIGFRLLADPPHPDEFDFDRLLRERVEVVPALELVGSRLAEPTLADADWQLADNQNNVGVVVGTRAGDACDTALERRDTWLEIGTRVVHDGPAEVPGGDAFATFAALARVLGAHGGGLRAGHVCITGALSGPHPIASGERVRGRIAGLGEVSVRMR